MLLCADITGEKKEKKIIKKWGQGLFYNFFFRLPSVGLEVAEIFSPVILVLAFPFSFFLVLAICAIQPMREAGAEPCLSMRMALVLLFEFGAVCGGNVRGDAEGKTAVFFLLVLALYNRRNNA